MNRPSHELSLQRILDAEANRAGEGLRVVEDFVRFVLDDPFLTEQTKQLRHDWATTLASLNLSHRLLARDTELDVGTQLSTATERARTDAWDVAVANLQRVQQAFRSLEEYSKCWEHPACLELERLRYRSYTLEKLLGTAVRSLNRLGEAQLYVLVDGAGSIEEFSERLRSLIDARVDVIQLRDKELPDRDLLARARQLVSLARPARILTIINDRPDIARLCEADGVHVGQDELLVRDVRSVLGADRLVGVSIHDVAQARRAVSDGADYLGVGPTFPSRTKRFEQFPGLELVADIAGGFALPAFAIGGLDPTNVRQVVRAGMTRVAVGSSLWTCHDVGAQVQQFRQQLSQS